MKPLNLADIDAALKGNAAALRCITELQPVGNSKVGSSKVFPPTYEGGEYATEGKRFEGERFTEAARVLLDSVQSQANRMEQALLTAYRSEKLAFPLALVDFAEVGLPEVGQITALDAPHRIADAIFRDSVVKHSGKPFRDRDPAKSSEEGLYFEQARVNNATPLFELCPTALIFGVWDSTGPKGGLGAKFQRALVSEIVGFDAKPGVRPSSRIDPLGIEKEGIQVFQKTGGGWTLDPKRAETKGGKPVLYGKEGKPSEVNHGNITPSLKDKNGALNPGGFTISKAVQTSVLSLPAIRRLRFPVSPQKPATDAADLAAQATLVALGLCAIMWQQRDGYDLRSRCLLDGKSGEIELVGQGKAEPFTLGSEAAAALLDEAAKRAVSTGFKWSKGPLVLVPSEELKNLVIKSREKTAAAPVEG